MLTVKMGAEAKEVTAGDCRTSKSRRLGRLQERRDGFRIAGFSLLSNRAACAANSGELDI